MKQTSVLLQFFCAFWLLLLSPLASADRVSDIEKIFDWAEKKYPDLFSPSGATTQTIDNFEGHSWYYRYFPNTNTYMGISNEDKAYAYGINGQGLVYVDLMSAVLNLVDSDSSSAGNGNCVNIPLVANGRKATWRATNTSTSNVANVATTYTEVTETQAKTSTRTTIDGNPAISTSDSIQHYSIVDNYFEITKIDTTTNTEINGANTSTVTEILFSPAKREPAKVLCEGQTWTSSYTVTTKAAVSGFTTENVSSTSISGIVEAVNESKTIGLGTFNTVRVSENAGDNKTVAWTAVDSGILVYQESYDSAGSIVATSELMALE